MRRNLARSRQVTITVVGVIGVALTLLIPVFLAPWVDSTAARAFRDWVPVVLILLNYWQAGQFVTGTPNIQAESWLLRHDARFVAPVLRGWAQSAWGASIFAYLEIAYLAYYPFLPGAFAALLLVGGGRDVDRFWTIVLLAGYGACATLPFLQTRPPRVFDEKWSAGLPSGKIRAFNNWILRRGSIHVNTCPSAHVAIATACALALLLHGPVWVGLIFMWIAFSIAMGAVGGRYHYAMDAVLGALTAILAVVVALALTAPFGFGSVSGG
jgi:hypothetical protein